MIIEETLSTAWIERDRERIDMAIAQRDREINEAMKHDEEIPFILRAERKARADRGTKRNHYTSALDRRYRSYIGLANKRGLKMELTEDQFSTILNQPCVYCGTFTKIGIDRIDSSDNYTVENSQPCCTTCNWMKASSKHPDFVKHVEKIYRHTH